MVKFLRLWLALMAIPLILFVINILFVLFPALPAVLKPFPGNLFKWYVFAVSLLAGLTTIFWGWGSLGGAWTRGISHKLLGRLQMPGSEMSKNVGRTIKLTHGLLVLLVGFLWALFLLLSLEIFIHPLNEWVYWVFSGLWVFGHDLISIIIVIWNLVLFNIAYWFTNPRKVGQAK